MSRKAVSTCAAGIVLVSSAALGTGPAHADRPPPIDDGRRPVSAPPAPPEKTELKPPCNESTPTDAGPTVPVAQRDLDFQDAWQFTRGQGQLVAVIDTGVARHTRLPGLIAGGDYVGTSDGTEDCDIHGTIVAGIIGASAVADQGFSGVAPDAQIMSIRQSSDKYQVAGRSSQQKEGETADGYGDINTLASAIVWAADRNASVVNISLVSCKAGPIDDRGLGAALRYAVEEKNVVVVAAAGNSDRCEAGNPDLVDPLQPDADPWDRVTTVVSPARYDSLVLTVGSVDPNGSPSKFTVPGPWVDVAAPGEAIVSLDPSSQGLANRRRTTQAETPFDGTSFAAPYVSGTVALVRARYPQLTAKQVMDRIEATAHAPAEGWNPYVGHGIIDPYAAVTADVSPNGFVQATPRATPLPLPAEAAAAQHGPRNVALIGTGIIAGLLALGVLASFPIRRRLQFPAGTTPSTAAGDSGIAPS
ncbi:type VII secretion-associated serine protease mycosin [Antrihabitans sp. YC2-6]|uniref:type VII secretion-associated serine protease mycosin n=1 Tax=Antrihabitans sp. YC2-6 TaxID=2799498 RepID=UPI001F47715D|nr:type VII secretion-associated serine protease mycosin [Antrihabitans sp. YC2-6]